MQLGSLYIQTVIESLPQTFLQYPKTVFTTTTVNSLSGVSQFFLFYFFPDSLQADS